MFFIRRYREGIHQSGTVNVAEWEERPSIIEFITECEMQGDGKYVLFERGAGIRGMRKINEYTVKIAENPLSYRSDCQHDIKDSKINPSLSEMVVFAAEEIGLDTESVLAVKKNMKLKDLSDDELVGVLDQIAETEISSAEGFAGFKKDLKGLLAEFRSRNTDMSLSHKMESENKSNKAWYMGSGFAVGGIVGVLATASHYKGKLNDLEERLMTMESSVKETETRMKKQAEEMEKKKKADEAVRQFDNRMGLDARFLSTFNSDNGPKYL
jgi:hypothetical protein